MILPLEISHIMNMNKLGNHYYLTTRGNYYQHFLTILYFLPDVKFYLKLRKTVRILD